MSGKPIKVEDLPQEVRERYGLEPACPKYRLHKIPSEIPALGQILSALKGLSIKQARWCLDAASKHLINGSKRQGWRHDPR